MTQVTKCSIGALLGLRSQDATLKDKFDLIEAKGWSVNEKVDL